MQKLIDAGHILFPSKLDGRPREKKFRADLLTEFVAFGSVIDDVFTGDGTNEIRTIFGEEVFDFSKPSSLLLRLVKQGTTDDSIVLDFFAGSGSTGHAVLELNKQDGGNRKFVLIQLPELCDPESTAYKAGYRTIADICKERIRRVIKKLDQAGSSELDFEDKTKLDRGFKCLKLDSASLKHLNAEAPHEVEALEKQLDLHVDHIREGRTVDDLFYEVLLKSGYPLTTSVEMLQLAGKQVHSVSGGLFFVCLERELTLELIRAMAEKKPERVVCLDEGFAGNDQLKANAVQIFRTKGVTSFKTV